MYAPTYEVYTLHHITPLPNTETLHALHFSSSNPGMGFYWGRLRALIPRSPGFGAGTGISQALHASAVRTVLHVNFSYSSCVHLAVSIHRGYIFWLCLLARALPLWVFLRAPSFWKLPFLPARPNYPLRDPKCHQIETRRPLIDVHWGV